MTPDEALIRAAAYSARQEALEEAARVAERYVERMACGCPKAVAAAIRELKQK